MLRSARSVRNAALRAAAPVSSFLLPSIKAHALATPNEVRFTQWQWNLFAPTTSYTGATGQGSVTATAAGGSNLPSAWDSSTGKDAVVAIIDTGLVNHLDLNGTNGGATYIPAGRFLPGYDFVSSANGSMSRCSKMSGVRAAERR